MNNLSQQGVMLREMIKKGVFLDVHVVIHVIFSFAICACNKKKCHIV